MFFASQKLLKCIFKYRHVKIRLLRQFQHQKRINVSHSKIF